MSMLKQFDLNFRYSHFVKNIELEDSEEMSIYLNYSNFDNHTYFKNISESAFHINHSILKGCNKFSYSKKIRVFYGNCTFTSEVHDFYYDVLQSLAFMNEGNNILSIVNCYFKISKLPNIYTEMLISNANRLIMESDTVEIRIAFFENISRDFNVGKCIFKNHINFEGVELPTYAFKAAYSQLKDYISFSYDWGKKFYSHKDTFILADDDKFRNVLQIYARLYDIYKRSQDTKSAEECYVDMKNFMLRKQEYDYRQEPTLKNLVDWQFNRFIGYFSVYGTDSALALIHIMQWISLFAVFYFIFPSEKDNLNKKVVFKEIERLGNYLTSEKRLSELHLEETLHELQDLYVFRASLKTYQGKIPWTLQIVGTPFYWFSYNYYKMQLWFWKHSELSTGAWVEQNRLEKAKISLFISLYLVFFLLWGVIMRAFNAIMLSLNVFTTLGYGEMQARGWIKYLAVLEGAVGWFLLTVFSASLVSQLLQ